MEINNIYRERNYHADNLAKDGASIMEGFWNIKEFRASGNYVTYQIFWMGLLMELVVWWFTVVNFLMRLLLIFWTMLVMKQFIRCCLYDRYNWTYYPICFQYGCNGEVKIYFCLFAWTTCFFFQTTWTTCPYRTTCFGCSGKVKIYICLYIWTTFLHEQHAYIHE